MANIEWPWHLATIRREQYQIWGGPPVRRTEFDSGAISQRRIASRGLFHRKFTINVKSSQIEDFRTWLRVYGHREFRYRDFHDEGTRSVVIVGGADAVFLEQVGDERLDDGNYWKATVEIEGYDTVVATDQIGLIYDSNVLIYDSN